MWVLQTLILIYGALASTAEALSNLHVFVNRTHNYGPARVITTLETLGDIWFSTKVRINQVLLVDYFQTNTSETREPLLWYRTASLQQTLEYFGVDTNKKLPYNGCFYHVSIAHFFRSGFRNVTSVITMMGVNVNEISASTNTFVKSQKINICEPFFNIPNCQDSNQPLIFETSEVLILLARFYRYCPMDRYNQYYWTLHDSTESRFLEFLGETVMPELKLARYRLKVRDQSELNRLVLIRLNVRVVGRREPLVARCYIALASQRLFAGILGGEHRRVFRGVDVTLNANPSRDFSLPPIGPQYLQYEWSCTATKKEKFNICKENMGTGKRLVIPAYSQPYNQTLRVVLHVHSIYDPLRTATSKQTIEFSSSREFLNIDITCVSNCDGDKYSTLKPSIHLKGECYRCSKMNYIKWNWRIDNRDVEDSKRRLIYNVKGNLQRRLFIQLNVKASRTIKSVTRLYYGVTWVTLEKNMGPSDTECTVMPRKGNAMKTIFQISCDEGQARFMPLRYCVGIEKFLIQDCRLEKNMMMRLPPTNHVIVKVCDYFYACEHVNITVQVERAHIENSEAGIISQLSRVQEWLAYADWHRAFILLYQLTKFINTKNRLVVYTDSLATYKPQTMLQLTQIVRLTKRLAFTLEPLDDMKVIVLARMLNLIGNSFKLMVTNKELNTIMEDYYETMVNDLCDLLNNFNLEWEYIPKSQCRAESESCLNIDNFRNNQEQMSVLKPNVLEHVNNWLHAYWKLSRCLFYMGMGAAQTLRPEEQPLIFHRETFSMRMESFDLDNERIIELDSADKMHTLIFTAKLVKELRTILHTDEVLLSVRSHKLTQYWWYPDQDSNTQVLVVNAYTPDVIWEKVHVLKEPIQYISKLKMNFSAGGSDKEIERTRRTRLRHPIRHKREVGFDDPEEDIENVINDNVRTAQEIRMYRTDIFGHSVLGVTFTETAIDLRVLISMNTIPKLRDIEEIQNTCLVKAGTVEPTTVLLRNLCEKSSSVFIYLRAANIKEPWNKYEKEGAKYAFSTEMRSCRIWSYKRPEPQWRNSACIPEMNKTVFFGIHCRCNYISDFDANAQPILTVPMNLKCHLERPVVGSNYLIIAFYLTVIISTILFLFLKMQNLSSREKRIYVEHMDTGKACSRGDIVVKLTFGGRANSGSSANLIFSFISSSGRRDLLVYNDSRFDRNNTVSFRLHRDIVQIPARVSLGHDGSGMHPNYFCRFVLLYDNTTEQSQHFRFYRWIHHSNRRYASAKMYHRAEITPKESYKWRARFSHSMENNFSNWYLFQPLSGPWRMGLSGSAPNRWERSCIFFSKLFVTLCIVAIYYGRGVPIACDPHPKKYNDVDALVWLCLSCIFMGSVVQIVMELILRMTTTYD